MDATIKRSRDQLEELLAAHEVTSGLLLRVRGKQITLVREEPGPGGAPEDEPCVRLTHLGQGSFGISVLRHTGSWERTPFSGNVDDVVEVLLGPMQHLVAKWP